MKALMFLFSFIFIIQFNVLGQESDPDFVLKPTILPRGQTVLNFWKSQLELLNLKTDGSIDEYSLNGERYYLIFGDPFFVGDHKNKDLRPLLIKEITPNVFIEISRFNLVNVISEFNDFVDVFEDCKFVRVSFFQKAKFIKRHYYKPV